MNTKEAIEFVEMIPTLGMLFDPLPLEKRKKQLIELLQCGEKFEKIVKEMEKEWGEYRISAKQRRNYTRPKIIFAIDKIKQKYFPKK